MPEQANTPKLPKLIERLYKARLGYTVLTEPVDPAELQPQDKPTSPSQKEAGR